VIIATKIIDYYLADHMIYTCNFATGFVLDLCKVLIMVLSERYPTGKVVDFRYKVDIINGKV